MKTFAKTLTVIALFSTALLGAGCGTSRPAAGARSDDSMMLIPRHEYRMLRAQADDRYVVVRRRTYDSLVEKTRSLQEVCNQLVKHLPDEVRSEH